ncbi:MAG: ABC transporter ATP-binding protein [Bacteroidales bacterium]|nr:ABC transporter ATP-binding protein [Bacteroidales bacterium]
MIEVKHLSLGYGDKKVIDDLSFEIADGCLVLLEGPNGSGKSTLLRALAREDRTRVMLPTNVPKVKGFTLMDFARTGMFTEVDRLGRGSRDVDEALAEAMEMIGISHLRDRDISSLSDGEFRKGCIAAAISRRGASALLLDEPTVFLDVPGRVAVFETLAKIARERNIPVLFSSHDIYDAKRFCDKVISLNNS